MATSASVLIGLTAPAQAIPIGPNNFSAASNPNVLQGQRDQSAGDLTYMFVNNFTTDATVTFTLDHNTSDGTGPQVGNDCSSQAGIDKAVGYSALPAVSIHLDPQNAMDNPRTPTFTAKLGSSNAACGSAGVKDVLTVDLTEPSSGGDPVLDRFDIDISNIAYDVGAKTPLGDIQVTAHPTGFTPNPMDSTAVNAEVVNKSFTLAPRESATPSQTGAPLGTATFTETSPGAYFQAGCNTVDFALNSGNFSSGVTPDIVVPSGWTVYKAAGCADADKGTPATTASSTYDFYVKPAANAGPGTVSVAGLKADAPSSVQTVFLTPTVTHADSTTTTSGNFPALNVVDQTRIGGTDRYETAVKLFNSASHTSNPGGSCSNQGIPFPGPAGGCAAVLSGGQKFPDALSANFLGAEQSTATLLTKQDSLPNDVKAALADDCISKVYVTGQTMAVSKAVADEVAAIPVCGISSPLTGTIQVVRLGGKDRYATNEAVNNSAHGADSSPSTTAVLASGKAPYDSLAVGPLVYNQKLPLVLTDGTALDHGEEAQFQSLGTKNIVIVGGTTVVSQAVQDKLSGDGYKVIRVAGANRYATATQIARFATTGLDKDHGGDPSNALYTMFAGTLDSNLLNITNGQVFADALSAGPVAGQGDGTSGEPILLAKDANTVGPDLESYLGNPRVVGTGEDGKQVQTLNALGLNAATSPEMMRQAAADIGPGPYQAPMPPV